MSEPAEFEPHVPRCPDKPRFEGDIVGCGSTNVAWDDRDKVYDCFDCGIWFDPNREPGEQNNVE